MPFTLTRNIHVVKRKILFVVSSLVRKLKQQAREQMEERRPNLVAALHQMGDFYMELKWDFQSWGEFFMHFFQSLIVQLFSLQKHIYNTLYAPRKVNNDN